MFGIIQVKIANVVIGHTAAGPNVATPKNSAHANQQRQIE
jgi:hypothetical protein